MNFLALLGWSYDDKTTIMSRHELIERFCSTASSPSPATFDYEKLDWMNGVYLRALPAGRVRPRAPSLASRAGHRLAGASVARSAPLVQEKIERFDQYPDRVRFLFEPRRPRPALSTRRCRARPADALEPVEPCARADRAGSRDLADRSAVAPPGVRADPDRGHRARRSRPGFSRASSSSGRTSPWARLNACWRGETA